MSEHKGIRLRITTPHGDILYVSSLELHYTLKLRPEAQIQHFSQLFKGNDVEILAAPITEWEDDTEQQWNGIPCNPEDGGWRCRL